MRRGRRRGLGDGFVTARRALALLVACAGVAGVPRRAAAQGETGRIEGTVTISRAISTEKPRLRFYADYGSGSPAPPPAPDTDPFANIVLYLDSVPSGRTPIANAHPSMAQHHERFEPHTLPVLVGTTVDFPNEDDVYHNVFSLSGARTFDLGRYPKGSSKSITFTKPGIVQVFCHIHSDMSATILVLPNPFFVIPDSVGRYSLSGVPSGTYRLVAWNERIKPITWSVRVQAGAVTTLDLDVPLPADTDHP